MAAFAAKGIQKGTFFTIENLYENRGISFAMGGVSSGFTFATGFGYSCVL